MRRLGSTTRVSGRQERQQAPPPSTVEIGAGFDDDLLADIATLVGGLVLAGLLARPVAQLSRSTRAMSAGDLDQRVPVTGPREVRGAARR